MTVKPTFIFFEVYPDKKIFSYIRIHYIVRYFSRVAGKGFFSFVLFVLQLGFHTHEQIPFPLWQSEWGPLTKFTVFRPPLQIWMSFRFGGPGIFSFDDNNNI